MVNVKIVNGFMKKKIYSIPQVEVEQINMCNTLLTESPVAPVPPHPGVGIPSRRDMVF